MMSFIWFGVMIALALAVGSVVITLAMYAVAFLLWGLFATIGWFWELMFGEE